jgi:hypothetical protein
MQTQARRFLPNPEMARISALLKAVVILIFLPEELSFYLGNFRLTIIRVLFLFFTPVVLIRFSQSLASRQRHLVPADVLIGCAGIWMILAPATVVDLSYSLNHAGPLVIEFCGSYLAARTLLSERGQALGFVNFLCRAIAIVAVLGAPDALTGTPFIHHVLANLTGYVKPYSMEYRLGIFRSMGPIDHPVLYGGICVFGLLLAITSPIRTKALTIFACGLGVILSMSSAPIQAAVVGLGLIAYDRILAAYRGRWWLLIGIGALGIAVVCVSTDSPIGFIFGHLMLDTSSLWVRVYEWDMAGSFIQSSPWVGIAFQYAEEMSQIPDLWYSAPSIDSYWLNLCLIYGIPCATFLGLAIVTAICHRTTAPRANLTSPEATLAVSLGMVLFLVIFLGFTVDFWGISWMAVPLLVGVRAHLAELSSTRLPRLANRQAPSATYLPAGA